MSKKFIAFLDILGFKDLVENNSAEQLSDIYRLGLKNNYDKGLGFWANNPKYNKLDSNINSIIISDSIIIGAEFDNQQSFIKLLFSVQIFITESFKIGIPLRGVIEYDEMLSIAPKTVSDHVMDNSIILLGKAITNAYQLEQKQNWAGCVLSDNAVNRFEEIVNEDQNVLKQNPSVNSTTFFTPISFFEKNGVLIKYPVPFKSGPIQDYYCIDWSGPIGNNVINEQIIRESFEKHGKSVKSWDVESKIKNTIDFYIYSRKLKSQKK